MAQFLLRTAIAMTVDGKAVWPCVIRSCRSSRLGTKKDHFGQPVEGFRAREQRWVRYSCRVKRKERWRRRSNRVSGREQLLEKSPCVPCKARAARLGFNARAPQD